MWSRLALLLLPFALSYSLSTPETTTKCPRYMVIEAPGLGDYYGKWTYPTTKAILAKASGGYRYLLKTREPHDEGPNSAPIGILTNSTLGGLEIVGTVVNSTVACPNTKIIVFGYSYGTMEVEQALHNPAMLAGLPLKNIVGIIMYGNCYWVAGQTGNRGTAKTGKSVCSGISDVTGTPAVYQGMTADFCLVDDYLCTGTPYAWKNNTHWSYRNTQWQADAVAFAVEKIEEKA